MKKWTVEKRVIVSFTVVILAMVLMTGFAVVQMAEVESSTIRVETSSIPGITIAGELSNLLWQNFSLSQEHALMPDAGGVDVHGSAVAENWRRLEAAQNAYEPTIHTDNDRQLFVAYKSALAPYRTTQDELFRLENAAQSSAARDLIATKLKPQFEAIRKVIDELVKLNDSIGDTEVKDIHHSVHTARIGMAVGGVVALVLAILSAFSLIRELSAAVHEMQKAGIQVNTSSTEIAATAKQQQATASEIAATVTEIGATSKEISATSKELLRTVNDVVSVAEDTATLAGTGQSGLNRMEETMKAVMAASGSVGEKLSTLSEKATNINHVVTTITKVADQTNLLSLNAAIEAEKAGEFGRGFSVVANEIRRLADQTAVATEDIETTVKEMQSAVSAGVMGMDKFSEEVRRAVREVQDVGNQLSQIIHQVQTLTPRFEAVGEGMQAQSTGAQQISDALGQLSDAAKETAESLRQSNRVIEQLTDASNGLRGSVSRFKV